MFKSLLNGTLQVGIKLSFIQEIDEDNACSVLNETSPCTISKFKDKFVSNIQML